MKNVIAPATLVLTNVRIVTPTAIVLGHVIIENGRILSVNEGSPNTQPTHDLGGDWLLPGLVDVHTDHLESQFMPRPGVFWHRRMAAARSHDAMMVACGITTVLDSVCAEAFPKEETRKQLYLDSIEAVTRGDEQGLFKSRHYLHLRCETADPKVLELFEPHATNPLVKLVSLMDHTPGQRQYRNVDKYREHYCGEGWTDEVFEEVVTSLKGNQERYAAPHRQRIVNLSKQFGLPLASHDDATAGHVAQAVDEGIGICEFPTTMEAAKAAREAGMVNVMGAPNILQGGSHSGNISALEVLQAGCLDILASDYVPGSLLEVPFVLSEREKLPLWQTVALVSEKPAKALGLTDIGAIAPGMCADMLRVRLIDGVPTPISVWRDGIRVS